MINPAEARPAVFNEDFVVSSEKSLAAPKPPRVAILCDIVEENWPSMDLVGEMLVKHLQQDHAESFAVTRLSPLMRRRFTVLRPQSRHFFNADRVINRFWDYQRSLHLRKHEFDLFHVVDHSYAQLVHHLPPARTIVTCHDLDTFRCLLEPQTEPRSRMFKRMMRHVLRGIRKAARVVCDSVTIRDELVAHGLLAPECIRVIPLGVHPSCTPKPETAADAEARRLLNGEFADSLNLLHVGSTIERKRIDVLLEVFARVREEFPKARLFRVGGPFSSMQLELIKHFKLQHSIIVLPHLERKVLAAIYRHATLVLQPSAREGFGLPVIEAMACGTPVVASDIPALREVGGEACAYAPVGDVEAWTKTVSDLINERNQHPDRWMRRRQAGIANASRYSWSQHADQMAGLYRELLVGAQKLQPDSSGFRAD